MNLIKNGLMAGLWKMAIIVFGFVTRKVLYIYLIPEYVGVSTALEAILGALSLADLGFTSAVAYQLYKPLQQNNQEMVLKIMQVYKMLYRLVAAFIFVGGLALTPLIPYLIKDTSFTSKEIFAIYFIHILRTTSSYLLSYKRVLLYAGQSSYLYFTVDMFAVIAGSLLQIASLAVFKNYYVYLLVSLLQIIMGNIIVLVIADKKYPELRKSVSLDRNVIKILWGDIRQIVVTRISSYIYSSVDDVIISAMLGALPVALLSNYKQICSKVGSLISQLFSQIIPTIGNMEVHEDQKKRSISLYYTTMYFRYIVTSLFIVEWVPLATPFVQIVFGEQFVLGFPTVLLLTMIQYNGLVATGPIFNYLEAKGEFYALRSISVVQAVLNIVLSVAMVLGIGLNGVLVGTVLSDWAAFLTGAKICAFIAPENIRMHVCKQLITQVKYLSLLAAEVAIVIILSKVVSGGSFLIQMLFDLIIGLTVIAMGNWLCYGKTDEFKTILNILGHFCRKQSV